MMSDAKLVSLLVEKFELASRVPELKPLAFVPEEVLALRDRFPDAIAEVIDPDEMLYLRRHVFDFSEGLRLTIGRIRHEDGQERLRVHAWIEPDSQNDYDLAFAPKPERTILLVFAHAHLNILSGCDVSGRPSDGDCQPWFLGGTWFEHPWP